MNHGAFWSLVWEELRSTLLLYWDILRHPILLPIGAYHVLRDIFYELPRSFFIKNSSKNLKNSLNQSASQCITLSEIITIPGNYLGYFFLYAFGINVFFSSIIGANLGDYFSGALSYILLYVLLTRGHGGAYSARHALYDSCEVVKDCLPAAVALYITEAPFIGFLLLIGLTPTMAIALNLVVAMTLYIGVAKFSTNHNIEKRFRDEV